jgi:hypothetical protein
VILLAVLSGVHQHHAQNNDWSSKPRWLTLY